jgi:hypothetical protein
MCLFYNFHYMGGFIVTIWLEVYCTLIESSPLSLSLKTLPAPLKAIARIFLVLFHIGIWSPSTIYPHLNCLHSPFPLPLISLPPYTVPILQSCFSLLLFKLMFKGMSQCMPTVGILYFGPFSPFHYSPLPLYLPPPIFQQFSIHILISSTFTSYVLWYYWCSTILFSFPSFPEFHRVIPLFQTCSTSEFVCGHACFCPYVYLFDLSSSYEINHVAFVFLSLANFT